MKQSISCEANSRSARGELSAFYGNQTFITVMTRCSQWTLYSAR